MIIDLPDTTVSAISKALVTIREDGGAVALGRVLTLIVSTTPEKMEDAIAAANDASSEHPMRVIVVAAPDGDDSAAGGEASRLDCQIRVGGDAGASEVIILHAYGETAGDEESLVMGLLLPDAPVVVWWLGAWPDHAARSSLGAIATRRITDSASQPDPQAALLKLASTYTPGDTDLAWTRLTPWRSQIAAALDQPPYEPVTSAEVSGAKTSPSTELFAAWLQLRLGVPVACKLDYDNQGFGGIHYVSLTRSSGETRLERVQAGVAKLTQPGQPDHEIALPRRSLRECLAEELRHLDPDEIYGSVITDGLPKVVAAQVRA